MRGAAGRPIPGRCAVRLKKKPLAFARACEPECASRKKFVLYKFASGLWGLQAALRLGLLASPRKNASGRLYYFGARYYDPRTSVWQSADPILGKYLPSGNKEKDAKLLGMGGVYNSSNLGLYTYTHSNPVRLTDPDGRSAADGLIIPGIDWGAGSKILSVVGSQMPVWCYFYLVACIYVVLLGLWRFLCWLPSSILAQPRLTRFRAFA